MLCILVAACAKEKVVVALALDIVDVVIVMMFEEAAIIILVSWLKVVCRSVLVCSGNQMPKLDLQNQRPPTGTDYLLRLALWALM